MKVHGRAGTRSVRVTWALEEIGADYGHDSVDLLKGEGRAPGFLATHTPSRGRKAAPDRDTDRVRDYAGTMPSRPALARAREREAM